MEVYTMKYYPESYSKLANLINNHNKNEVEIGNLDTEKIDKIISDYEEELKRGMQSSNNRLLKRDLFNVGMPQKMDEFIKAKINFKILLNCDFEKRTHTENNNSIDYLEINELNCDPGIYALDQIDKIMLKELANPTTYSDYISKCKEYFEGDDDEEYATFLLLINNRLRKYCVLKIISLINVKLKI
jgi:hypothetical protein